MPSLPHIEILLDQRRYKLAAQEIVKALAEHPEDAHLHAQLADALRKDGRLEEAMQAAREAVRLDPQDARTHEALVWILLERDDLKQAESVIGECRRLAPECGFYCNMHAHVQFLQKEYASCLGLTREALRLDPQLVWAHQLAALALKQLGRDAECLEHCEAALKLDPNSSGSLEQYGNALRRFDRHAEAATALNAALRLNPNDKFARDQLFDSLRRRHPLCRWRPLRWFFADPLESRAWDRLHFVIAAVAVVLVWISHVNDAKPLRYAALGLAFFGLIGLASLRYVIIGAITFAMRRDPRLRHMMGPRDWMRIHASVLIVIVAAAIVLTWGATASIAILPLAAGGVHLCIALALRPGPARRRAVRRLIVVLLVCAFALLLIGLPTTTSARESSEALAQWVGLALGITTLITCFRQRWE